MKFDCEEIAPSGRRVLKLRMGAEEIAIVRGLIKTALQHTPDTTATVKTLERMKAMSRCLNSALVAQWIEHGDSTSSVAGSIPAEGTISENAQVEARRQ